MSYISPISGGAEWTLEDTMTGVWQFLNKGAAHGISAGPSDARCLSIDDAQAPIRKLLKTYSGSVGRSSRTSLNDRLSLGPLSPIEGSDGIVEA